MAQEFSQPLEDEAEVATDGAHDGVDLFTEAALEEVAIEMAVGLAMFDDRFDGGSPPRFLLDLPMDAALLTGFEDLPRVGGVVAPISFVHIGPLDLALRERLGFLDDVFQGMAVMGVSGERLGVQDELAALAPDIADQSAQAGAQEFDFPVHAHELLGVGVAPSHHRRLLGEAP